MIAANRRSGLLLSSALVLTPALSRASEFVWPQMREFLAPIEGAAPASPRPPAALLEIEIPFDSLLPQNDSESVRLAAQADPGLRVVVDRKRRELRLMRGPEELFMSSVAVGSGKTFVAAGRRFTFATPIGKRRVEGKQRDPLWNPPDWHYLERASQKGLNVVFLKREEPVLLGDGTILEIRGDQVGRTNQLGNWWPMAAGMEIVFDGTLFAPPRGTVQRQIPGILGPFKLDMGDGILIHGTNDSTANSIGQAASHGCVRVPNNRLTELYPLVPVGTAVYIY